MIGFLIIVFVVTLYFLPSIIAYHRKESVNFLMILLSNFFFGWTFLGWAICFIWPERDMMKYVVEMVIPNPLGTYPRYFHHTFDGVTDSVEQALIRINTRIKEIKLVEHNNTFEVTHG